MFLHPAPRYGSLLYPVKPGIQGYVSTHTTHTHTHTHAHAHMHTRTHTTYMRTCMHTDAHTCNHIHTKHGTCMHYYVPCLPLWTSCQKCTPVQWWVWGAHPWGKLKWNNCGKIKKNSIILIILPYTYFSRNRKISVVFPWGRSTQHT